MTSNGLLLHFCEEPQNNNCSDEACDAHHLTDPCSLLDSDIEPSRIQFLLDDPLILQNLIIEEKARCFDLRINLPIPTDQTCQAILWSRLRRAYQSEQFEMRLTRRNDETVVILNSLAFASQFSTFSTNVKNVRDWTGVPSFVQELIHPSDNSDSANKYVLLIYEELYGWELIGCIPTFGSPVPESQDTELLKVKVSKLVHSYPFLLIL